MTAERFPVCLAFHSSLVTVLWFVGLDALTRQVLDGAQVARILDLAEQAELGGQVLNDIDSLEEQQREAGVGHSTERVGPAAIALLRVEQQVTPPGIPVLAGHRL